MSEWSQQPEAVRHRRLVLLLLLGWLIGVFSSWHWLHGQHEDAVQTMLERDLAALSISWQAVQSLQRNSVITYVEEYVEDPLTIELLQAALDPDRIDLARLELFRHLSPAYVRLVERGVRQFHFHLPNGDSLLRFHHPERFGDNLFALRESIRLVNSTLEPVFGFEVGRVVSGYRSVFPVIDGQGQHLGSVELSMPFKVLQNELQTLLPNRSIQLLLHAQRQRDILFYEQQSLYEAWPASAVFLVEDPHGLRPDSPPALPTEIEALIQRLGERPELIEQMRQGQEWAFPFNSNGRHYAILLVPVFDPSGAEVGVVVSYHPEPGLAALEGGLRVQMAGAMLGTLVLVLILFFLLRVLGQKLDERNRLKVITDTVGQGLYLSDADGRIISANPYAQELLGFSEAQMQGQCAHDLFHRHESNEFEPSAACPIIQAVQAGREYRDETVFRKADNQLFETMVVSRPLMLQGRFVGTVTVFENIQERKATERALQDRDHRLRKLGAELPGFVYQYLTHPEGSSAFIYASDGIQDIYGVTPKQVEQDAAPVFAVMHANDLHEVEETIAASARNLTPWHAIYRVHHPDKGTIWVEGHATPERLDEGSTIWHGYIHDVTERERARRDLEESEAKYRTLVENAPVVIYRCEVEPPWRMLHISRSAERLSGHPSDAFLDGTVSWGDLIHPEDATRLEQAMADVVADHRAFELEYRIIRNDGAIRWMREAGDVHRLPGPHAGICLQGIITDITEQKSDQVQLQRSAHYDALTGLPNRVLLADRLEQAMVRACRSENVLAVLFIDLDNFKPINDEHGHATGDDLLVAIAERMRNSLRSVDTLARLGGDEFVAVLSDLSEPGDAQPLVRRVLEAVAVPLDIRGLKLQVTGSIGLTFYPQATDQDADQLLRQADQAMYQSKVKGRNTWQVFDLEHDASLRGRHAALERFKVALDNDELVLHYQPQVNLRTGHVSGVEALIRWQHPERGLLMPGEFLPVIERSEVDIELGQWVLSRALEQRQRWSAAGLELTMAVNLSAHCLQKPDFLHCIDQVLTGHPELPDGGLEFEILESSALSNLDGVSALVRNCAERGIGFALDDFGTGYSSLSYLKRLPVSVLKVDRCFVGDLEHDVEDLSILEGVLGLSRAFRMDIVAEGVETIEQGSLLLQLGCERAQGFGIARPMPADEVADWIRQWRPHSEWRFARVLEPREYPLVYALVAAQACIDAMLSCAADSRTAAGLPSALVEHIERVVDQPQNWPDRQVFLRSLGYIYRRLCRLAEALQCAMGSGDESRSKAAVEEIRQIQAMLAKSRADLA